MKGQGVGGEDNSTVGQREAEERIWTFGSWLDHLDFLKLRAACSYVPAAPSALLPFKPNPLEHLGLFIFCQEIQKPS